MLLKKAKESWKNNFDKVLASSERKEFAKVRKYYDGEYLQAIDDFLKTRKTTGFDNLFRVADISDHYRQIYVNIGVKFAKWYAQNFDKVISKQVDVSGYDDLWAERFNRISQQIAAERVTLVQGTAKATLVNVFKRLSSDPEFMVMGEREASRVLRQKFGQYSNSQAKRLIRTESTNAANMATLQSATDMFGQDNLQKEWMTAVDGRERAAHRSADGQIVDFKERFLVGGEQLFNPGDPAGSAKNVVNCRCSTAPFPKEDAQAAGTIEGFGVNAPGLPSGTKPPKVPTQSVLRTPKPVREAVEEVVDELPDVTSIKDGKIVISQIFRNAGLPIKNSIISSAMELPFFNKSIKQLKKLTNKYKINSLKNTSGYPNVIFRTTKGAYGYVERYGLGNRLKTMNFGHQTNSLKSRTRVILKDQRNRMPNSPVDAINLELSTVTHEFAHVISSSTSFADTAFFDELKEMRNLYNQEIRKYSVQKNYKAFNETYLGTYANHDIDEFLAEAFTEYELSNKPSKYARLVGELVEKYYKK